MERLDEELNIVFKGLYLVMREVLFYDGELDVFFQGFCGDCAYVFGKYLAEFVVGVRFCIFDVVDIDLEEFLHDAELVSQLVEVY